MKIQAQAIDILLYVSRKSAVLESKFWQETIIFQKIIEKKTAGISWESRMKIWVMGLLGPQKKKSQPLVS